MKALGGFLILAMLATGQLKAQPGSMGTGDAAKVPPLFASHDLLEFSLASDFEALKNDREQESEERPAEIRLANGDAPVALQVRTRGRYRLQRSTCPHMPPIRLNFPKKAVRGTVFEGQDKVKLVTHCRNHGQYEQNTLEEYLIYRMYNELTNLSLRVRLARITYIDTSGNDDPVSRYAFIVEHEDGLAERLGGTIMEPAVVAPSDYVPESLLRYTVFQHMIGNTDFSTMRPHNTLVLRTADGHHHPVPYDFDWSGFVNARYAKPDASLGLRNVRQRLYRGVCLDGFNYGAMVEEFLGARERIEGVIRDLDLLGEDARQGSLRYLHEYFELLNSPEQVQRQIVGACRAI